MSIAIASESDVISFTDSGQEFHLIAKMTATNAVNYPANGESLAGFFSVQPIKVASDNYAKAITVDVCPAAGDILYNFTYDRANNKLKAYLGSTGAELAAGAYPNDVLNAVITLHAWFRKA